MIIWYKHVQYAIMSRSLNGTDPIQTTLWASTGTSWHEAEWSVIISSDNGLSPGRCQAIIWNNAGMLLNGPLGTNFSEILIKIYIFSFNKMHLKRSSAKRRPFCHGLHVLMKRQYRVCCDVSKHHIWTLAKKIVSYLWMSANITVFLSSWATP